LVLHNGTVAVEARVDGARALRRLSLRASPKRPKTLSDLLRRSQFERVVAAITNKELIYLEAVPTAGIAEYEPADVFSLSAVEMRARMGEHVRKLEDTGLATYQGNDPVTFILTAFTVALILGLVGWGILESCKLAGIQDDDVCHIGAILVILALGFMLGLFAIFVLEGVGLAAIGLFGAQLMLHILLSNQSSFFPGFEPSGVPVPP